LSVTAVAYNAGLELPLDARITFDTRVYSLAVIKKAAYRFLKTFVAEITQEGDAWVCTLKFATPPDAAGLERASRDLQAEVLDQDLRASISQETEPMRNAILALAFSRSGLQGSE
jgi:His-Xaa-Ser system protein HxsD